MQHNWLIVSVNYAYTSHLYPEEMWNCKLCYHSDWLNWLQSSCKGERQKRWWWKRKKVASDWNGVLEPRRDNTFIGKDTHDWRIDYGTCLRVLYWRFSSIHSFVRCEQVPLIGCQQSDPSLWFCNFYAYDATEHGSYSEKRQTWIALLEK